jgi:hypothetical protein
MYWQGAQRLTSDVVRIVHFEVKIYEFMQKE